MNLGRKKLKDYVRDLAEKGLMGIEVYYSEQKTSQVEEYRALTGEFGLVATGGSDFHGLMNPQIELGRGFGNLKLDDIVLENLKNIRKRNTGQV